MVVEMLERLTLTTQLPQREEPKEKERQQCHSKLRSKVKDQQPWVLILIKREKLLLHSRCKEISTSWTVRSDKFSLTVFKWLMLKVNSKKIQINTEMNSSLLILSNLKWAHKWCSIKTFQMIPLKNQCKERALTLLLSRTITSEEPPPSAANLSLTRRETSPSLS